ncbi:MAG: SEC-C domain-containing protein [Proteobacteria bacterium]|nr:SEC-C domain-containing protein [Pseudomonadota bacterium]
MDIDIILNRADWQILLFADFILDKYRDLKESDPESARKIETRVFTRSFLLNILDNGDMFMRSLMFAQVPPSFFVPVMDELSDRYENGSISDYGEKLDAIIKANAPDVFLRTLKQKIQQQIDQAPVTINTFYWQNHFEFLPRALCREYFEKTHALLLRAPDSLAESPHFHAVLSNQASIALLLDRPEAVPMAKTYLEHLVQAYATEDFNYYDVCLLFRHVLTLERFLTGYPFELNLFFDLENNENTSAPKLLDSLYPAAWSGGRLFDLYNTLIRSENLSENSMIPALLSSINEPLLTSIIRTLIQDKALMLLLESHHLHHAILAVFASIVWQFHRKEEIESARFSDANVLEFITIDSKDIPCMAQIKTYLSGIPPQSRVSLLCAALEKGMGDLERVGDGEFVIENAMELMAHFRDPAFVPGLANVFLYDFDEDADWLIKKTILALSCFKDEAIDCLDSKVGKEIPEFRLLDMLDIIRKIGTPRAEDFLIKHFDCFLRSFRADTLATCQNLVSQKALALLGHKVGKNQKGIDELYVIVTTLRGKADGKTQEILDSLASPGESLNGAMDILKSGIARSVLTLALECSSCGDINDYECSNIITSPQGDAYVAQELTCISCNRISEFNIAPMGQMAVTAELLRLTTLKSPDETKETPFTGAVRFLNASILGKQISLAQGIALYKEKIRKNPKKPDLYIGLGNVYKSLNQYTFAEEQYQKAIEQGPFYIEAQLSLAEIAEEKGDFNAALDWLEKGRPYLKRPVICKDIQVTAEQILEAYVSFHFDLLERTGRQIPSLLPSGYMGVGKQMKRIGRNEKCPCGSNKKYKKCCMKGQ